MEGHDALDTGRAFAHLSRSASFVAVAGCYLLAAAGAGVALLRVHDHARLTGVLAADLAATLVVFALSMVVGNSSLYDPYWSVVPPVVAVFLVLADPVPDLDGARVRQGVVVLLVLWWGVRLTSNWALGWQGMSHEDWRYRDLREKTAGRVPWWVVNLGGIQLMPTLVVFVAMLSLWPALGAPRHSLGPLDAVAALVTFGGVALESLADHQRRAFAADPANHGSTLATGVWSWSRHPNYLGEITFWWGLWLFGLAAAPSWWWTVIGPLVMVLLFVAASIPLMEERNLVRRPDYAAHVAAVPRLLPVRRPLAAAGWVLVLGSVVWLLVTLSSSVGVRTIAGAGLVVGLAFVARGLALRRRILSRRLALAVVLLVLGGVEVWVGAGSWVWLNLALAGLVLVLPPPAPAPGSAHERAAVSELVMQTSTDPLAPFSQRTDLSYAFSPDGGAAVAYRVGLGTAVVAGDPVGDPTQAAAALEAFVRTSLGQGFRVAGLGTAHPQRWRRFGLRAVPIGRDVVLHVDELELVGRQYRNLRQAAQRARNAGVQVAVVLEQDLAGPERDRLMAFAGSIKAARGFSMILDHPLDATHPGTLVAVATDRAGAVVAVARFASADQGRELSLDVPWRGRSAPNGTEELMMLAVVDWARERGGRRVSLAFAPFPELFARRRRIAR